MTRLTARLAVIVFWIIVTCLLISCEKEEFITSNYEFEMVGRTYQDSNGFYHLTLDSDTLKQTLHRFGAYITNVDKWNLQSQVAWRCDAFW